MEKRGILIILFFLSAFAFGQHLEIEENKDLKVGLVLSGGGAKGLAHIGALKVIEESGVRIDYIAGTSMGAIVGALYASGYSADQLEALFKEIDFNKLISDETPREIKSFLEKEDEERRAFTLPFSRFKLTFPTSLSPGQNNYNIFVELLDNVKDVDDFSKLPIPFFCIATDVETGKEVVLENGYLPQAIAASGALPSLFEPVLLDGKLLLDGGIVNNYPVYRLKEKGVDIVIGVDVQDGLKDRKALASIPDVLLQISNFQTQKQMKTKADATDIYIKPNIKDFSIVSFDEGKAIFKSGLDAATKHLTDLKKVASYQEKKDKKPAVFDPEKRIQIDNLEIEGNENYSRAYVLGKLKLQLPVNTTYKELGKSINALAATNNFNVIHYKIEKNNVLKLFINEKESQLFLKAGLHYDGLYKSAALLNLTKKQFLTNNDIVSFDLILGDEVRYDFNYYIDKGYYWSLGLKSRFNSFDKNVNLDVISDQALPIVGLNKIDLDVSDLTNQFYIQTMFRKDLVFAIGAEHKLLNIKTETVQENNKDFEFESTNYFSTYGNLRFDNLDDKYYPTKGFYFNGDLHWFLHSSAEGEDFISFSVAKAKLGFAQAITKKVAFSVFSEGGIRIGNNTNNALDFVLGGYGNDFINNYKSFFGYDFLSIAGDSYVKSTLNLDYEIFKKQHLLLSANYANIDDGLFKDQDWLTWPEYSGYAIGYGIETLLGPLEVRYSWSPEGDSDRWFFSLGYWF